MVALPATETPSPVAVSMAPAPVYSDLARQAGVEGKVRLRIVVGIDGGTPRKVEVTGAIGWGLDEEALKSVSQWIFRPAEVNGQRVESAANVECQFAGQRTRDLNFGAMTFDLPHGSHKPVLTAFVPPDYVRDVRGAEERGEVSFLVSEEGRLRNFHMERETSKSLQVSVLNALRQWRFTAAMQDRQPIAIRARLCFTSASQHPTR